MIVAQVITCAFIVDPAWSPRSAACSGRGTTSMHIERLGAHLGRALIRVGEHRARVLDIFGFDELGVPQARSRLRRSARLDLRLP